MRGVEGKIQKERLVFFTLTHILDGEVGEGVGSVVIGVSRRRQLPVAQGKTSLAGRPEIAGGAGKNAVVAIKSALARPFGFIAHSEMPLAGHVSVIAGGMQNFCERNTVLVQITEVARRQPGSRANFVFRQTPQAGLVRMQTSLQSRARRGAAGGVVKLRQAQSARSQRIQIRRGNFRTETAEIGITHVIGQDEHEVGPGSFGAGGNQNMAAT